MGIGGGASGISGGLLHPYSPKGTFLIFVLLQIYMLVCVCGCSEFLSCHFMSILWNMLIGVVKPLWEGAQCWKESIKLLRIAEDASLSKDCKIGECTQQDMKAFVASKRYFRLFSFLKVKRYLMLLA